MASHPYLRFLARVSARQPLLRPPPDASITQVSSADFLGMMPYTHPISGYRSRSFEWRQLELRIAEVPSCPPPSPTSFGSSSPSQFAHRSSGAPAFTPDTSHTGAADAAGNRTSPAATDRSAAPMASLLPPSPSPAASPSGLVQPLPPPPHSYMEVHYPFTTLPWLWRQYHRPGFPGLDPALVIEDFDTFAADVAARHVGHVPDSMLVTAFLERMTWHVHLRPGDGIVPAAGGAGGCSDDNYSGSDCEQRSLPLMHLAPTDMRMSGQVTWVGRSSMEVLLQLTTAGEPAAPATTTATGDSPASGGHIRGHTATAAGMAEAGEPPSMPHTPASEHLATLPPGHLVATAEFVMALRDSSLRRAVYVPPLHPRDELERELFQRGREHQRLRQSRRDRDTAPTVTAKPGSPLHVPVLALVPASLPTAGVTTAGAVPEASAELARMLYDSVLLSGLFRTLPSGSLRLLQPDLGLDVEASQHDGIKQENPEGELWDAEQKRVKRRRLDDLSSADSAIDGGVSVNCNGGQEMCRKLLVAAVAAPTVLSSAGGGSAERIPITPIRQTEVHRTVVAEFQDRNTSGTVFGGHLLRLAYEHAATAAAAFAGGPCELLWMEEGAISSPAHIGDVLHAVARVVWSEPGGRALRVVVRVGKYSVSVQSQHVLALTLAAVFLAPPLEPVVTSPSIGHRGVRQDGDVEANGVPLRGVVPMTLTEAGEALTAQQRHEAAMAMLTCAETKDGVFGV